jgi:prepilin-type N-terminal cleavage/methylation domain-containing protein
MQVHNNERGITLVELLAVLAILSIILLLVGSAHIFGQRQYFEQNETIDHQGDVRLIMSQLTTDVRKVTVNEGAVTSNSGGVFTLTLGTNTYTHQGTTLKRNGVILSENISTFKWSNEEANENEAANENEEANEIEIESVVDDKGNPTILKTVLYFRR